VIFTVREALREMGVKVADCTAAVQGFGNVSQYAVRPVPGSSAAR